MIYHYLFHKNCNCNNIFVYDKVGFAIQKNIKDKTKLMMRLQKELQYILKATILRHS
jgi:hypothetical protein